MELDYEKLGLRAGLECHQQLDSRKLFCNCPSILRSEEPSYEVERKLHLVAGETGETDLAAEYEAGRDRVFLYQGYNTTCLVELDESPPNLINQESLKIAIQISLLLNCEILPTSQIMRKTVIDGSNTAGFQRTVLIARNGYIETSFGKVGIQSICLEEDAARIINQEKDKVIYRLDRLGIPLVEIATSADIHSPEQAKESALHIGEILRACKVKRGIGTIRQDVNMSIKAGKRIEIKGVQELKLIAKTIETETVRQIELVKQGKSIAEVRKANPDGSTSFLRPLPGAARMYPETDLSLLKISKKMIDNAKKTLPKLKAEHKQELTKLGLSHEMMKLILENNKLDEFKELYQLYKNANLIAKMLILWPREIASHEKISLEKLENKLSIDVLETILQALNKKQILESEIKEIMQELVRGKSINEALKKEKAKTDEIEEFIIKIVKEKPNLSESAYMGLVMSAFKGKITGKEAIELIRKHLKA